ncbi:putative membrane protein [Motilibacter rhizosphaerae]|uniref:Putative membrane protein n=1 Tax=Motilibacter rhizosphaerae TaxID=598652 RepID=A0A4Q7NQQ6_9ACTN|nr:DMT family transporter [Motilibacter rhizosphaerae]RZS89383.1 putative membrane protein [Motilibacter rhizosphaerae]
MGVLLALLSAVVYGSSDFCGGLATRRAGTLPVVVVSQAAGLLALLALLVSVPGLGEDPTAGDIAWGVASGLGGGCGLLVFYRALATSVMSVAAPVTAVSAAAAPVLVGLALGDAVTAAALVGIVLALVAVVLISAEGGLPSWQTLRHSRLGAPLLAGAGFGVFFVTLDQARSEAGLWPLVGARAASILLVVTLATATRRSIRLPRPSLPLVVGAGVLDMSANALYLLATAHGVLAVTGLLASLYPVSTVLLAQAVLRERLVLAQVVGLGAATGAVVLISLP